MNIAAMDADLRRIHDASMQIVEANGMRLFHPGVLEILVQKGIRVEGRRVYFTRAQIEQAVSRAPSSFTIYARNPIHDVRIGDRQLAYAPGFGAPAVARADGSSRPARLDDFVAFLKLFHQSDLFKLNGGVLVQPADVPLADSVGLMLYACLTHTDKSLLTATGTSEEMETLMEMLALVFGGKEALAQKPRATTIVSINTPFQFDRSQLETLLVFLENGQPVVLTPGAMAGTTAPITMAGALALANADLLTGIALAQTIRPGAPVVYGIPVSRADMHSAANLIGTPEFAVASGYGARLARAYGLPSRAGGSLTDARGVCAQAGYESMMTCLASHQAGVNLIIHAAGIVNSFAAMSYEKFILDLEILAMVKHIMAGMEISAESLAVAVTNQVGAGGEFLTHEHTLKNCRRVPFLPAISVADASGDPHVKQLERMGSKKKAMLSEYRRPALPPDLDARLYAFMIERGFDVDLVKRLRADK